MKITLALALLAGGSAANLRSTPFGLHPRACVHEVPAGSVLLAVENGGTEIYHEATGLRRVVPACSEEEEKEKEEGADVAAAVSRGRRRAAAVGDDFPLNGCVRPHARWFALPSLICACRGAWCAASWTDYTGWYPADAGYTLPITFFNATYSVPDTPTNTTGQAGGAPPRGQCGCRCRGRCRGRCRCGN